MRCPSCSYLYFKQLDVCPKCGNGLGAGAAPARPTVDEKINTPETASAPVLMKAAAPEAVSETPASAPVTEAPVPETAATGTTTADKVSAESAMVMQNSPETGADMAAGATPEPAPAAVPETQAVAETAPAEPAPEIAAAAPEKPKSQRRRKKAAVEQPAEASAVAEPAAAETSGVPVGAVAGELVAETSSAETSVVAGPTVAEIPAVPETTVAETAPEAPAGQPAQPSVLAAVAAEPAPPPDENSFALAGRPPVAMEGIELRAPAPLPAEIASGQKNAEFIATGGDTGFRLAVSSKPRVRVVADRFPAIEEAKPAAKDEPVPAVMDPEIHADAGEVSFHPAPAPLPPKPLEPPKPPVLAVTERPLPELKVPKLELPKVELPKPKPVAGDPIARRFADPAGNAAGSTEPVPEVSALVEVLPESVYEYEFDVSNPMIAPDEIRLDTRGAGAVLDPVTPKAEAGPTSTPSGGTGDDTFTRLVAGAATDTPALEMPVHARSAEEIFDITRSPDSRNESAHVTQEITGFTGEIGTGEPAAEAVSPDDSPGIDEISDNLAARVAGEPLREEVHSLAGEKPVRTLFPEILQYDEEASDAGTNNGYPEILSAGDSEADGRGDDHDEDRDDDLDGDDAGPGGRLEEDLSIPSAFDGFDPNIGAEVPALASAAVLPSGAILPPTDSSGPQSVLYDHSGGLRGTITGGVSHPSWTPPERRIEQILDEITDMSQRLEGPVVPSPEPLVPFNDGRFPGAMSLDLSAGEMPEDQATRLSLRPPEPIDPDQISFRLGQSRPELTPESQLMSAEVIGQASGIGIRLDTPPGIGLTGKLDDFPAAARTRVRGENRFSGKLEKLRRLKPRLTLPRQLVLKRATAYLIDTGITFFALALFVVAADKFTGAEFSLFHEPGAWIARTWWVLLILKTLIEGIFYVGLVSLVGQTPGDMIMKLKIVARDGADATPALVIRRYFWLWPFNLIFCWGGLPLLVGSAETAHDRRAGTRVVETV